MRSKGEESQRGNELKRELTDRCLKRQLFRLMFWNSRVQIGVGQVGGWRAASPSNKRWPCALLRPTNLVPLFAKAENRGARGGIGSAGMTTTELRANRAGEGEVDNPLSL